MPDPAIEQLLAVATPGGVEVAARSPGVPDEWVPEVERLCSGFGPVPPEPPAAPAVFAQPLGRKHVAVVQAAVDKPPTVRFHLLVLPQALYAAVGDPFLIAEQFPPPWGERVVLPPLAWEDEVPARTVEKVGRVLQEADSATLLGAAQALVDGGRVVFERAFPAPDLLRRLWALLPDSTRGELWPASYAFGNDLRFHALVVAKADPAAFPGYLTEPQAGDYPEGRYELGVQTAAESGDQAALDALFARRSGRQTVRLAFMILVIVMGLALASRFL